MPVNAKNINISVKKKANLNDTISLIKDFVQNYSFQVADLAKELKGENDFETGKNIWFWVKDNIQYVDDTTKREKKQGKDVERVRTPARTIADGKGDCDCMTVLVASLLKENDIKPYAKIVAYPKKDSLGNYEKNLIGGLKTDGYSHIYTFFNYKNKQIFIDTVLEISEYNTEFYEPIVKQKIIDIMELEALHGTDRQEITANAQFDEIILGRVIAKPDQNGNKTANDVVRAVAVNTLKNLRKNLESDLQNLNELQVYINHNQEIDIIDSILNASDENDLTNKLIDATQNSKYAELYEDLTSAIAEDNNDKYSFELVEDEKERLNYREIENLGRLFNRNKNRTPKQNKFFNTAKKVTLAPARSAYLQLIKLDFLGMGKKLLLGQMTANDAKQFGISDNSKFVTARNSFFAKWKSYGGKETSLKTAISKSRANKKLSLNGVSDLENELRGLGIVDPITIATGLTATATPVMVAFNKIFKGLKIPKQTNSTNKAIQTAQNKATNTQTPDPTPKTPQNFAKKATGFFKKASGFIQRYTGKIPVNNGTTTQNDPTPPPPVTPPDPTPNATATKSKTGLYIGIGIAIVAVIVIFFLMNKNSQLKGVAEIEKRKRLSAQKRNRALNGTKRKRKATPKRKTTAVAKRKATPKRKTTSVAKRKTTPKRKTTTVAKRKAKR